MPWGTAKNGKCTGDVDSPFQVQFCMLLLWMSLKLSQCHHLQIRPGLSINSFKSFKKGRNTAKRPGEDRKAPVTPPVALVKIYMLRQQTAFVIILPKVAS